MDGQRFDRIAIALGTRRRAVLGALLAGAAGAVLGRADAAAGPPACQAPGQVCKKRADCCATRCRKKQGKQQGRCKACGAGRSYCNGACCAADEDCVGGTCACTTAQLPGRLLRRRRRVPAGDGRRRLRRQRRRLRRLRRRPDLPQQRLVRDHLSGSGPTLRFLRAGGQSVQSRIVGPTRLLVYRRPRCWYMRGHQPVRAGVFLLFRRWLLLCALHLGAGSLPEPDNEAEPRPGRSRWLAGSVPPRGRHARVGTARGAGSFPPRSWFGEGAGREHGQRKQETHGTRSHPSGAGLRPCPPHASPCPGVAGARGGGELQPARPIPADDRRAAGPSFCPSGSAGGGSAGGPCRAKSSSSRIRCTRPC